MSKNILNSSDKSNFILNMTPDSLEKLILNVFIGMCIAFPLVMIPTEIVKGLYTFPTMLVTIFGTAAIVFVLIAVLKKNIYEKKNIMTPAVIFGALLVYSLATCFTAIFKQTAIYGQSGRNEGLLTFIFYACIFFSAYIIIKEKNVKKLLDFMVIMGVLQCVMAVIQILPIDANLYYKNIWTANHMAAYLPSGFTGNPISFAVLLTMLLCISLNGAIYDDLSKRRTLYTMASILFAFMAVGTSTIVGFIGMGIVILSSLVIAIIRKQSFKNAVKRITLVLLSCAVSLGFLFLSPSINDTHNISGDKVENGIYLYDGALVWEDGCIHLGTSGYYGKATSDISNLFNPFEVYKNLWGKTIDVIQDELLTGVGADCLIFTQFDYNATTVEYTANTFDRPYNDYLYIAATRGIPALILYIGLLVIIIRRISVTSKAFFKTENDDKSAVYWMAPAMNMAVIGYALLMVLSFSTNTVTPFFWLIAGMAMACKRN